MEKSNTEIKSNFLISFHKTETHIILRFLMIFISVTLYAEYLYRIKWLKNSQENETDKIIYRKILGRIVGHSTSLLRCPGPATLPPTVA